MTRLISACASEILSMSAKELKQAIKASEGRVIAVESHSCRKATCDFMTTAELDVAFGADMVLCNLFDVNVPYVLGLNEHDESNPDPNCIKTLREYIGRPVGLNLEPVNIHADMMEEREEISNGRIVTVENVKKVQELGFDFICITGNPKTGVDNASIIEAIKIVKENFDGLVIAGKMHSAGVDEPIIDEKTLDAFIKLGVDIVLAPGVGSVPGFSLEDLSKVVKKAHQHDVLVMSSIGTSQEGSGQAVIEQMAITNKIAGVDIQHIGDVNVKENIYYTSVAIRGRRHTYARMAMSVKR